MNSSNSQIELVKELEQKMQQKDFAKSIDLCNALLKTAENKSQIFIAKSKCQEALGRIQDAKNTYIKGLESDPGNIEICVNLAKFYLRQKEYDKSIRVYKILSNNYPKEKMFQTKKDEIKAIIEQKKATDQANTKLGEHARDENPLKAAFNISEIKECNDNLKERDRRLRDKKLKNPPIPPKFDSDTLAEEWVLAAIDAMRDKQYQVALLMCIKAAENNGNLRQIYTLAGEIYLSNKQYNAAHLCYQIASEHGDLDHNALLNLISLAISTGDKALAQKRYNQIISVVPEGSPTRDTAEKMISQLDRSSSVYFHPEFGPVNSKDVKKRS